MNISAPRSPPTYFSSYFSIFQHIEKSENSHGNVYVTSQVEARYEIQKYVTSQSFMWRWRQKLNQSEICWSVFEFKFVLAMVGTHRKRGIVAGQHFSLIYRCEGILFPRVHSEK